MATPWGFKSPRPHSRNPRARRAARSPTAHARTRSASAVTGGFGETSYAGDLIDTKSTSVTVFETFSQTVYQFAGTHAAASFYSQLNARYRSCRTVTSSDGKGDTIRRTVRSQSKQRVGGHRAKQLVESVSVSKVAGQPLLTYVLWTIDGTNAT